MRYRLFVVCFVFSFNFCKTLGCILSPNELSIPASSLLAIGPANIRAFGVLCSEGLNGGCTGGFNTFDDMAAVRQSVLSNKKLKKDRLLSFLGFCRSELVLSRSTLSIIDSVDFASFLGKCEKKKCKKKCISALSSGISHFENRYKVVPDVAERLSILTAFTVPWDEAISLLRDLCSDGGFSHEYSLTEALFVLHMKPEIPGFFSRKWRGKTYDDEMLFYAKCLAGALACVLKNDKKISDNFEFDISPCSDNEQFVTRNIGRLLREYVKTFPDDKPTEGAAVSKKVAVANFPSYDSSQKLKKD